MGNDNEVGFAARPLRRASDARLKQIVASALMCAGCDPDTGFGVSAASPGAVFPRSELELGTMRVDI